MAQIIYLRPLPNVAHHLTSSLILTNHKKIFKNLQNGTFKVIFSAVLTDGAQMKLMKQKFWQWWNSNIYLFSKVAVPIQHMAIFCHLVAKPYRLGQKCFESAY